MMAPKEALKNRGSGGQQADEGHDAPQFPLTSGHDVVHGDRQEEERVPVIAASPCTEEFLHGLHRGLQLLGQHLQVVEDHLSGRGTVRAKGGGFSPNRARDGNPLPHCPQASFGAVQARQLSYKQQQTETDRKRGGGRKRMPKGCDLQSGGGVPTIPPPCSEGAAGLLRSSRERCLAATASPSFPPAHHKTKLSAWLSCQAEPGGRD